VSTYEQCVASAFWTKPNRILKVFNISANLQLPSSGLTGLGVGSGKLLLAFASIYILGSGSRGTCGHIFLPHDSGSRETHGLSLGSQSGKLLLALASTIILGSGSRRTHDHVFLSHDAGSRATNPLPLVGILAAFV
jgi:hypothetical protein